ncbi:MAG: sigma-70 family RNA polymerase sigma factor [Phycisphaeraceae bacterium]|nr:MAG: sigma-70 family RNA polymerase sigma factor [Phycisphaeraceae bacterium]
MPDDHESANGESGSTSEPAHEREAYGALRRLAAAYLQRERSDHTLQPTALVHEAYIKLAGSGDWKSETHFQAVAANAMRQILVDHARARNAQKRGGGWLRVTLTGEAAATPGADVDLLALDEALQALAELDERKARVVELRFFGGLTCAEAALEVGVSPKTAEADWYFARAWLRDRLSGAD